MELIGHVKNYAWGKIGFNSLVAKLSKLNSENLIESDKPYAELWMGDHPSGNSKLKLTNEDLGSYLAKEPSDLIGCQDKLPFLFKVLSVEKALSIQVHPNKTEAERLHKEFPDIYKDPNHKPELAIALTPFTALCGFRPFDEIYTLLTTFNPLCNLIGNDKIEGLLQEESSVFSLKNCYFTLMMSEKHNVSNCIEIIHKDYYTNLKSHNLLSIFETLKKDFPNDIGILSIFFFNVIKLNPGESIFLSANEPHAYLEGDCIECMACSDNVIRAGLTPKFKDINTLLNMLNYNGESAEKKLFKPIKRDDFYELFIPPVKDFAVGKLNIPLTANDNLYKLKVNKYGSIVLVLSGERMLHVENYNTLCLKKGSIIFIPGNACEYVEFFKDECNKECNESFIAYIAMYNDF